MSLSLNQQVFVFCFMALYGVGASILFDLFRSIYKVCHPSALTIGIGDILFWAIISVSAFFALFIINNAQIRMFEFLAMILGSLIYFLTLSSLIFFIFSVIVKTVRKIFSFFFKICLTIALFLYKMVLRLLTCVTVPFRWLWGICNKIFKHMLFKFRHTTWVIIKNSKLKRKMLKSKRNNRKTDLKKRRKYAMAKGRKNKKKTPPVYMLLRVLTIAFAVFAVVKIVSQQPLLNQYNVKATEYENQIQAEKDKIEHYKNLKELYKSEEYKMLIAKERLGLVEENEKVYVDASGR